MKGARNVFYLPWTVSLLCGAGLASKMFGTILRITTLIKSKIDQECFCSVGNVELNEIFILTVINYVKIKKIEHCQIRF